MDGLVQKRGGKERGKAGGKEGMFGGRERGRERASERERERQRERCITLQHRPNGSSDFIHFLMLQKQSVSTRNEDIHWWCRIQQFLDIYAMP